MFMGSKEQRPPLQPLLPCRGGLGPRTHPHPCYPWGIALSVLPSLHVNPRGGLLRECKESQLQSHLSPWAASPAEIYSLCLSQGPRRLNYRSASRLDWASNLPVFAKWPWGRATGPARPGTSELGAHSATSLGTREETEARNEGTHSKLPPGKMGPV